jgi:hypothetical protein
MNCYRKVYKKLKVKSEEVKEKIHKIIIKMIKGAQDDEDKEKFEIRLNNGWDKVIRGFQTN